MQSQIHNNEHYSVSSLACLFVYANDAVNLAFKKHFFQTITTKTPNIHAVNSQQNEEAVKRICG